MTRGGGEADLQAPHASVSAEAPPRDRSVARVMPPEKLSNDECRFINMKRLITEYIPAVLRQLFVLRWNERHPDDKWDDSDKWDDHAPPSPPSPPAPHPRWLCGKKLLKGVEEKMQVPSCTFKLTRYPGDGKARIKIDTVEPEITVRLRINRKDRGHPKIVAIITVKPPLILKKYVNKIGVAVDVVRDDGSPVLREDGSPVLSPGGSKVEKIDPDEQGVHGRQLVVVIPKRENEQGVRGRQLELGGLRLRTPRVLPPDKTTDVDNHNAQEKILKLGLDTWDVSLCFWALTDAGRRLVDSPTSNTDTGVYPLEPHDKRLYKALKAVKDIRNEKFAHSDGLVDEDSWTEIEEKVLELCEVLNGEFAKMLPEQAADGSALAKLRMLVTRKLDERTDNLQAMYHVKFYEQSALEQQNVLELVMSHTVADLEAQTSKLRWMQQPGSGSEEATLQDEMKAMQEELMEAGKVHKLATRVGCQVEALKAKISQAGQYLVDSLETLKNGQGQIQQIMQMHFEVTQMLATYAEQNNERLKDVQDAVLQGKDLLERQGKRQDDQMQMIIEHLSALAPKNTRQEPKKGLMTTRPIVPLSREALADHERGTATSVADRAADAESTASSTSLSSELIDPQGPVRTLLTLTLKGELETFDVDTFKKTFAKKLEMQPESIQIEMEEKPDRTRGQGLLSRLYEYILRSGDYRVCVRVDKDGYLEHVESISSGSGSSSEQSDANPDLELHRDGIKHALRWALSPRRKLAKEHIDIRWIRRGSVIVCIELDLPYALKLLELVERKDATLDEMHISRCVIGEEGGEEGGAPASACNPHDAAIEVTEAEVGQFDPELAAIIFAPDHFAALGLKSTDPISDSDVSKAVKRARFKAHPDRNPNIREAIASHRLDLSDDEEVDCKCLQTIIRGLALEALRVAFANMWNARYPDPSTAWSDDAAGGRAASGKMLLRGDLTLRELPCNAEWERDGVKYYGDLRGYCRQGLPLQLVDPGAGSTPLLPADAVVMGVEFRDDDNTTMLRLGHEDELSLGRKGGKGVYHTGEHGAAWTGLRLKIPRVLPPFSDPAVRRLVPDEIMDGGLAKWNIPLFHWAISKEGHDLANDSVRNTVRAMNHVRNLAAHAEAPSAAPSFEHAVTSFKEMLATLKTGGYLPIGKEESLLIELHELDRFRAAKKAAHLRGDVKMGAYAAFHRVTTARDALETAERRAEYVHALRRVAFVRRYATREEAWVQEALQEQRLRVVQHPAMMGDFGGGGEGGGGGGEGYGENASDIAADVMAAHIAAAPAIGPHVGETRGGGEADLQAPLHGQMARAALNRGVAQ